MVSMTLMTRRYLAATTTTLSKSLLKATDIHISVAYFFSVDDVVDIVEVYPAHTLYKKNLALAYTKRILLLFIQKETCLFLFAKNIARVYTKRISPY